MSVANRMRRWNPLASRHKRQSRYK